MEIHSPKPKPNHKSTQHKTFSKIQKNKMQQKFLLCSLVELFFYTALVLAFAAQIGIPLLANARM
jgi:hypothetical protein